MEDKLYCFTSTNHSDLQRIVWKLQWPGGRYPLRLQAERPDARPRWIWSKTSQAVIASPSDMGYNCVDFAEQCRSCSATAHEAQKEKGVGIDGRTTRHTGYQVSLRIRKRVEEERFSVIPEKATFDRQKSDPSFNYSFPDGALVHQWDKKTGVLMLFRTVWVAPPKSLWRTRELL